MTRKTRIARYPNIHQFKLKTHLLETIDIQSSNLWDKQAKNAKLSLIPNSNKKLVQPKKLVNR